MSVPLVWHHLLHAKTRTMVAVAGVAFAVLLIFMQLGFLGAVEKTATMHYDSLAFDICLRSKDYLFWADARTFPRARLEQAAALSEVASVKPLYIDVLAWRNPQSDSVRAIMAMGIDTQDPVYVVPEIVEKMPLLRRPRSLLIDRFTRREFGPRNGSRFSDADVRVETEVSGQRMQIAGHFGLGTGLAADGAILVGLDEFERITPQRSLDEVSLGLVALRDAAAVEAVQTKLRSLLPDDVEVLTRAEVVEYELWRWVKDTSIGVIFQLGVIIALLVGLAIVYQVLSVDVSNQRREYATLRAMGYRTRFLEGVVLRQALALAAIGFVPGLLVSLGLYQITSGATGLPIRMNSGRIAFVLGLTVLMCSLSGMAALRKLKAADPADLF